ncbi:unnamed protein product [Paramecium octaurelia]|uniref:FCH domain-containing protein n=1 Tax=Paramecium octaurelia TaxID=43137 RepID=A0A8S1VTE6_PAROT|nr:unnamed protein product [Paramecium octaurelia]
MQSNYADLFFSHFQLVANQSQQGRKIIEEIIESFEERVNIEEKYAKSLEKLVNNLTKIEDKQQMFKIPIYCLKCLSTSRQRQAEGLCQSLKEDLIVQLKQLIQQQNASSKKLIEEAKKIEKEHQFLNSEYKRYFLDYKQKKREYEQNTTVMVVYNLLSEYPDKKRLSQNQKVSQVTKESQEMEQRYKQSVADYNINCDTAKTRIQTILTQMQEQEEKRITVFKDTLIRQIIFEVSHSKNVQYDLDKINEKTDEIHPEEEVQKFAQSQKLENPPLFEKTELIQLNSFISNSLQKFFSKEFDEILQLNNDPKVKEIISLVEQGGTLQTEDQKLENAYYASKIVSDCWKEEQVDTEIFNQFKKKIQDDYQLRKLVIIALQYKRSTSKFRLGQIGFQNAVNLFNSILEICLDTFDAGTSRQLMNLSFTFHKENIENGKPQSYFIQNDFSKLQVWENRDLWETSIIQQIYEQIKEQQQRQKSLTLFDQIQTEKNMILTILTQMAQNMLLFNFKFGAIKDIMYKFMAFFELNEEISSDLFNAIEGFEKQKQLKDQQEKQIQLQQQEQNQPGDQEQQQQPPQQPQQQQNMMGKISSFFSQLNKD